MVANLTFSMLLTPPALNVKVQSLDYRYIVGEVVSINVHWDAFSYTPHCSFRLLECEPTLVELPLERQEAMFFAASFFSATFKYFIITAFFTFPELQNLFPTLIIKQQEEINNINNS